MQLNLTSDQATVLLSALDSEIDAHHDRLPDWDEEFMGFEFEEFEDILHNLRSMVSSE